MIVPDRFELPFPGSRPGVLFLIHYGTATVMDISSNKREMFVYILAALQQGEA